MEQPRSATADLYGDGVYTATVTGTCSRICTPGYLGEMHATYDRPVTVTEVLIKNN